MREVGRGVPVFEAAPVQGTVHPAGDPAPSQAAGDGLVVVVDDARTVDLPDLRSPIAAVVCTEGGADDPVAAASRRAGVPCAMGVSFDGGVPEAGTLVVVDCTGGDGVVLVVDGGTTDSGLTDVVATQPAPD